MADRDKDKKSILGLDLPETVKDPNAWRPSKAATHESTEAEAREPKSKSNASTTTTENREHEPAAAAWRPSRVNEERLRSLSPARGRKRFAMSPRTRLIFTAVLFACGAYFFVRVWLMPEAGELHVALAVTGVAMVLLFVSAIVGASRRRRAKHADDKSILRL
jgi:Flp pilus assembly protein TadB